MLKQSLSNFADGMAKNNFSFVSPSGVKKETIEVDDDYIEEDFEEDVTEDEIPEVEEEDESGEATEEELLRIRREQMANDYKRIQSVKTIAGTRSHRPISATYNLAS